MLAPRGPLGGPLGLFKQFWRYLRGYLRIFEDIYQKNIEKIKFVKKTNSHFWKMKKWARNQIIMVGKLNYLENDAELDGQWSNQMVKVWFYEESARQKE